jgi:hypothetical protein
VASIAVRFVIPLKIASDTSTGKFWEAIDRFNRHGNFPDELLEYGIEATLRSAAPHDRFSIFAYKKRPALRTDLFSSQD